MTSLKLELPKGAPTRIGSGFNYPAWGRDGNLASGGFRTRMRAAPPWFAKLWSGPLREWPAAARRKTPFAKLWPLPAASGYASCSSNLVPKFGPGSSGPPAAPRAYTIQYMPVKIINDAWRIPRHAPGIHNIVYARKNH